MALTGQQRPPADWREARPPKQKVHVKQEEGLDEAQFGQLAARLAGEHLSVPTKMAFATPAYVSYFCSSVCRGGDISSRRQAGIASRCHQTSQKAEDKTFEGGTCLIS